MNISWGGKVTHIHRYFTILFLICWQKTFNKKLWTQNYLLSHNELIIPSAYYLFLLLQQSKEMLEIILFLWLFVSFCNSSVSTQVCLLCKQFHKYARLQYTYAAKSTVLALKSILSTNLLWNLENTRLNQWNLIWSLAEYNGRL